MLAVIDSSLNQINTSSCADTPPEHVLDLLVDTVLESPMHEISIQQLCVGIVNNHRTSHMQNSVALRQTIALFQKVVLVSKTRARQRMHILEPTVISERLG